MRLVEVEDVGAAAEDLVVVAAGGMVGVGEDSEAEAHDLGAECPVGECQVAGRDQAVECPAEVRDLISAVHPHTVAPQLLPRDLRIPSLVKVRDPILGAETSAAGIVRACNLELDRISARSLARVRSDQGQGNCRVLGLEQVLARAKELVLVPAR